jgi:ArsR family transcriptional regulator, arsenate/arsenite/antimonite-responsive transcriptional repressor
VETSAAARILAALSHEHRLGVFRLLVEAGPEGLPAGEIADELGLPPPTLSFHLAQLSNAGLLRARQSGRFIHYSADFEAMNTLVAFLTENCCGGNPCGPQPAACAPARKTAKR